MLLGGYLSYLNTIAKDNQALRSFIKIGKFPPEKYKLGFQNMHLSSSTAAHWRFQWVNEPSFSWDTNDKMSPVPGTSQGRLQQRLGLLKQMWKIHKKIWFSSENGKYLDPSETKDKTQKREWGTVSLMNVHTPSHGIFPEVLTLTLCLPKLSTLPSYYRLISIFSIFLDKNKQGLLRKICWIKSPEMYNGVWCEAVFLVTPELVVRAAGALVSV